MLSTRCYSVASILAALFLSLNVFAQGPGSTPAADYFVHHKHASVTQSANQNFGSAVAISGDVMLSADPDENIEILRKQGDGSWAYEASLTSPDADIAFGQRHALATNGDWIAVGAKLDDTFGLNSGAVHMYKFDGADWEYRGALSHMAPHGSIVTDQFGMALAMDGDRMVVGSRAENGVGAAGAVHYFTYNTWLDMWLETGFIASEHTEGNSTSKYGESVDISGDWMIVGEHRNNTNGQFAGAAHIYQFYNQCWHHAETFYGDAEWNWLGYDVAISGTNAVAGAPYADTDGLNEAGAAKLYQLLPFSGTESFWTETFDITAPIPVQGDWFGLSIDIDDDLLLVGAPRDDDDVINGGVGYFMFDCTTDNFDCVAEGLACDAMQNDRLGMDVALSDGLAVIGAPLDDNIFENAGSAYVLGASDMGFACDLTAPGAPMVDLVEENDSGADSEDNLTRHTSPDFDVFLPGGGTMALMSGVTAEAGDALVWSLDGTTESEMVFLTEEDIDNGYVTMEFIYPGPVLPDGVYTYCAYIIDVFGNVGATDCLTITIDNEDPEPSFAGGAEYDTSNTDDYGAFLPGAMTPEECEGLAATAGGTWDGIFTDAATHMVSPGCYNVGANTYEWQTYATFLPDTTLYLDAMGSVMLDLSSSDNISATDNIAIDTVYADMTDFDCDDAGMTLPVTVTAVDMAGNLGTITIQVEILDEVAPDAMAQDLTVQLDASGTGSITAEDIDNGSNDACGIQSLALDVTSFGCADVGANTVTLTVTDNNGNVSTATATVTVEDNVAPTVITQDITVQLDATGAASITTADIDNGSSDACGIQTMSLDITSFGCADVGANTVTLMVTDNNGNSASATATVTVEDNVAPTAIAQNLTVELDGSGVASITADEVDNGSSDACGIASLTLSQTAFDCDDQGANTVTLTVTDNNGNVSTATATITVVDLVDPTAATQDITVQLDATGNAGITAAQVDNGSDDTCGGIASMTVSPDSFDCDDLGDNTVTLTVFDGSGNSATATATVTVEDNEAPALSGMPADITQTSDAGDCSAAVSWTAPTASDNCSATITSSHASGDTFAVGTTTVTYTATDAAGNTDSASFTVTVTDDEAPAISGMPANITQTADAGSCGAVVSWIASAAPIALSASSLIDAGPNGNWPHVVTLTTSADPTSGSQQTLEINVTSLPSGGANYRVVKTVANGNWFQANPQPLTLGMNTITVSGVSFQRSVKVQFSDGDVEFDALAINGEEQTSASLSTGTSDLFAPGPNATWTHVFTATTAADPNSGDQQTVEINVTALPSGGANYRVAKTVANGNWFFGNAQALSLGSNTITVSGVAFQRTVKIQMSSGDIEFDSLVLNGAEQVSDGAPTASDNCGVASLTSTHDSGDTFAVGTTTVTYTATDIHGNTTTSTFTVTVTDDEAPAISGTPANITQTADAGNCSAGVNWIEPTASDNCAVDTFVSSHSPGATFAVGTTTVTYTATDIHGNQSTSTFTVTVTDDEAPAISGTPANISQDSDLGSCTATVTWTAPTASDNCGLASLTSTHDSGDSFFIGTTTVTYTATDIHGNISESSFTVTINEVEAPVISGMPADITQTADAGLCSAAVTWTEPTASDNCNVASFTSTHNSGDAFAVGTTTVTYTAVDNAGNSTSASFTVTVTDDEAPSTSGTPADITQTNDAGNCSAAVSFTAPSAADNCAIDSFTSSHDSGDTFPVGSTTVTFTATDIHGNTTTSTFTVTVTDDESPVISGTPADMTQTNDAGNCSAAVTWTEPTAADNCAIDTFTSSHSPGATFSVGATTVTYTATDIHGNQSTSSFTVTVTDDEAPAIAGMPADMTLSNDAGDCSAIASWTAPTSSDNCGVTSFTSNHDSGDSFAVGSTTVTYTAMDAAGNTTTASFTVTVTDDEDPAISGMPADINKTNDAGNCSAVASWTEPTATDNCAIATFTSTHSPGDAFAVGTTTVTYTATDIHGNSSTASFDITVTDDEDPSISGMPADITQTADAGLCSAVITWADPSAADNCGVDTFTSSHSSGDAFAVGTTTVTYTATDIHGNSSTASFDITVTDDEDPTISGMPADISQTNDAGECMASVTWTEPTAADNCAIATFTSSHDPGDEFPVGTTTVTYTATDIHGNTSSDSFDIEVTDDEAPTISGMPADISQSNDAGECAADVSWTAPTAGDNCAVASFTSSHDSGDTFAVGTTTVTYSVTDIHGNSTSSSFTVTVTDDENPAISPMAADETYQRDGGEAAAFAAWLASYGGAAATDNCGIASWSDNSTGLSDDCGSTGTETVTFTVTDIHSNSSSTTATFTVIDDHAPSCPLIDLTDGSDTGLSNSDNITNDDTPTVHVVFTGSGVESAEAGDIVELYIGGTLSQTHTVTQTDVDNGYAAFETGPLADGAVGFSALHIDDCGQSSIFAFLNIIVHSTNPSAAGADMTVVLDEDGNASIEDEDVDDGSEDDFNVIDLMASQTDFDCSNVGANTVTLTVTDIAGNTATTTVTVTVEDNLAPTVELVPMGGITVELGADGTVSVSANDLVASASDNCGIASMALDITSFDCDDLGDNAVVVTVTDVNGNTTTANATVTVEDNLGPIVEVETGSGAVAAVDVTLTFTTDNYGAGEAFATLYDSDGGVVADYPLGTFPNSDVTEETVSLDPGTYTIVLGDDWGDGWSWFPATGLDALVLSGGASGSLDFVDGNSASLEFTVEAEAPAGPGGITVELGPDGTVSIEPGDVLVSATDNCGVDGMSLDISDFDCDDLGNNAVVLTVTDVNGNSTSETAYVTVEDNEAPVVNIFDLEAYTLYAGETCVNEVDLFAAGQPWYEATDNCGADVEIVYDVINETGMAGCREFDRRWIIHAMDASGNTDSDTTLQHITVLDDTAPMVFFDNVPEDLTIELGADCSADIPAPETMPADSVAVTFTYTIDQYAGEAQMTVLDSEGEVIEFIDLVNGVTSTYPFDLYFTNGTDNTGGFTLIQTLNLVPGDYSFLLYDDWGDGWVWSSVDGTDALVLSGGASGSWDFIDAGELTDTFTVEGTAVLAITASATDNCTAMPELGDITYVDSAPQALCEDAGSYTITRTFMATATDECGNETVGEYIQTLTFLDVTAPQITDSEGIDNGETISETDADDIFAFISVPNPIDLDAADACGGDVTIVETESFSGFVPTDDIGNYCGASTPAAFLDGEACDGSAPAAIVLEGAYFGGEAFTIADGSVNIVESFYDQTLHIEVEVTNADGTGGFIWSADYNEAFNWAQWSGLGRGYKKDCANVLPGQSPWTGWDYFVMQTGGMIGTGIYAGSELSLTHQPMNYYYGLQVGQGANNQNAKYGASAWFYWSGELVVNGASQGSVASSGDIMLDLDCTMPWSAEYAYTVSDACGNTTTFSYTVEGDESNVGGAYVSGEESGHQPFDISVVGDLKDPIRVTGLMPNPTNDVSQLGFVVSHNMRLRVDLYNMAGELIQELYDGNAMTDVEYLMNVDANGLEAGMYQIRIASSTYMAVKKLLVTQ